MLAEPGSYTLSPPRGGCCKAWLEKAPISCGPAACRTPCLWATCSAQTPFVKWTAYSPKRGFSAYKHPMALRYPWAVTGFWKASCQGSSYVEAAQLASLTSPTLPLSHSQMGVPAVLQAGHALSWLRASLGAVPSVWEAFPFSPLHPLRPRVSFTSTRTPSLTPRVVTSP